MPKRRGKNHLTSGRIKEKVEITESMLGTMEFQPRGKAYAKEQRNRPHPSHLHLGGKGFSRRVPEGGGMKGWVSYRVPAGPSRPC